jgi:CheY-like chemotaxis protein
MNDPKENTTIKGERKNILILDDDRKGTPYLVEELRDTYFYQVTWLKEAKEVMATLIANPYDAIIFDLMMPTPNTWSEEEKRQSENGMSTGNILYKKIREKYPKIPILILTAKTVIGIDKGPHTKLLRKPEFVKNINDTLKTLLYNEK